MSLDDAIKAAATDALGFAKNNSTIGLGSGRAAGAFATALARQIREERQTITCIPTSMQIRILAEELGIPLADFGSVDSLDAVFDGADQIDSDGFMIKGGGGALLRERILMDAAGTAVVIADETKFAERLSRAVPVEVHPLARRTAGAGLRGLGAAPALRMLDRGYPFVTENGNLILDCDFGIIERPYDLAGSIKAIAGVVESGIFRRRPDALYRAASDGSFEVLKKS